MEIAPRRRCVALGGEEPAAVLRVAEQRREAGAGVEAGKAEPVDRAAALDEEAAEEYETAFNRAVQKRWPPLGLEIENR